MDVRGRGLAYGAGAYFCWGVLPVYWALLQPAGSLELVAHRIVWSLVFVAALLAAGRRWSWLRSLTRRQVGLLAVAAVVLTANWGGFIWGVAHHHVVETSLGYFINPLITVLLGVLVLRERLRRAQWYALALGGVAVLVLAVDYGRPPWLALLLAFSFGTYGLMKNRVGIDALHSVAVETAILGIPAGAYLVALAVAGDGTFGAGGGGHSLLLALTGPITAIPLVLFGAAARRLPLSVLGMLQYLAPVLQFGSGVLVFHEPMPPARLAGFALVWAALVLLTAEGVRNARRARRTQTERRRMTLPVAVVTSNAAIRSRGSGATTDSP
jgi:chloramphenicol-sensitive protein RarD